MSLISVILPSYNHERYVEEAIASVLAQTHADLELIIIDDASTDGSRAVIDGFGDQRIRRHYLPANVGGAAVLNHGIALARGDLIAICNSDDAWYSDKLTQQVAILQEHAAISAVFSDVDWIDGAGNRLAASFGWLTGSFTHANRSSGQWLRRLIEEGNCLCHPSILIRRGVYDELGPYSPWLRQLPDMEMWLRLLQRHSIFVMADRLVKFRWHSQNTSQPDAATMRRSINEHRLITRQFFEHVPAEVYFSAFGRLSEPDEHHPQTLRWEKALYLMEGIGVYERLYLQMGWEFAADMLLGNAPLPRFVGERLSVASFQSQLAASTPWLNPIAEAVPAPLHGLLRRARRVLQAGIERARRLYR